MARGILSGALWGAGVSALGLAVLSVAIDPPTLSETPADASGQVEQGDQAIEPPAPEPVARPEPSSPDPAPKPVVSPRAVNQGGADPMAPAPGPEADAPVTGQAPGIATPGADDTSALAGADTDPAGRPEADNASPGMAEPATAGGRQAGISVQSDPPVQPTVTGTAPAAPQVEEGASISIDPAQPLAPEVGSEETALLAPAPADGQAPDMTGAIAPAPGTAPAPAQEPVVAPGPEAAPRAATEPAAAPVVDAAPAPGAATETPPETTSDRVDAPLSTSEQNEGLVIGRPAGNLDNLAPGVKQGRLPSVTETPATGTAAVPAADAAPAQATGRAIIDFAEPVEVDGDKPLMSIVLIDDGTSPIGAEALDAFPYPLSFAVDAGWSGARQAMETYRARGFEVLALVGLPEGARASDLEVTLEAVTAKLPEAVALMEAPGGGLQGSREITEQLNAILTRSGHGLLLLPKGLNTGQAMAAKEGIPARTVFRDFDGNQQSPTVIRRFLDQAAFKASQEGGVIMVGRLRADTISALLLWGLQDRATRVALVPVSQVLLAEPQ